MIYVVSLQISIMFTSSTQDYGDLTLSHNTILKKIPFISAWLHNCLNLQCVVSQDYHCTSEFPCVWHQKCSEKWEVCKSSVLKVETTTKNRRNVPSKVIRAVVEISGCLVLLFSYRNMLRTYRIKNVIFRVLEREDLVNGFVLTVSVGELLYFSLKKC